MFQIVLIMKLNITMILSTHRSKKGTLTVNVNLDTKDPEIPQNYQNMFGSCKIK